MKTAYAVKFVLSLTALSSVAAVAAEIDPLVPFDFKAGDPAKQIAAMKTLREKFGLKRFIFTAPGHWRLFGRYDTEAHVLIGRQMAEAKDALKSTDIEIGWWDDPTIRGGFHEPGQHIMDCDGAVCDALCPLDAKANAVYCDYLKMAAKTGRPSIYFFEDDFTLSNHSGLNAMKGCFCPLHLAEYARRVGKTYTAKEIAAMFRNPTAENEPLRRAFAELSRDSLAQLGRQIRAAIDEVDPGARVCLCQSGFVDVDGDSTEAIARALAGNTRPMVRIYGAGYYNQNRPCDLPTELAHTYWSAQHLPKDIELLHESDPYPHSRFFNSSRFLMSEIGAAYMAGVDDSFLYCTMYSDDPLCDTGYAKAFDDNRRRFAAVKEFRRKSQLVGVRAVYDPEEVYLVRETEKGSASGMLTEGAFFLAKLGFPMTTCRGSASVLFGSTAKYLSEEKLKEVLAGAVLVDAEAAIELQNRGLGRHLGCAVTADDDLKFYQERTLDVPGIRRTGADPYHSRIPSPPIIGWTSAKSIYARLKPSDGAEVRAVFEDMGGRTVTPSFVSAKNELGGTVGVIAFSVNGKRSPALYSPLKQEMFRDFFVRASQETLDVCAPHTPATWLTAAVSNDGYELLVMVNNLAGEPREDIALDFSAKWQGGRIERLTMKGGWKSFGTVGATTKLGFACEPMVPEFVRVTRADKPLTRRQKITADYMEGYAKALKDPVARPHEGGVPFRLGVAGHTFHSVGVDRGLEIMKAIDCHVLCHKPEFLPYSASSAEIAEYKAKLAAAGVETVATGPLYSDNEKEIREQFEFAKRFGLKVVVGVPFDVNPKIKGVTDEEAKLSILPPEEWCIESDRVLDIVDRLVKEYDICYAIHNHGPDNAALFATAEAALDRIGNRDKRIGVCLDVGHELRAGINPVEFIRRHGDRIYDVHLKNVKVHTLYNIAMQGPRGELDVPAVLQALADAGYAGACHVEYEKNYDDNLVGMAESIGYYRGCMDSVRPSAAK